MLRVRRIDQRQRAVLPERDFLDYGQRLGFLRGGDAWHAGLDDASLFSSNLRQGIT